jgi:regulator of sigma E protease
MILTLLLVIAGFSLLILVHEVGHFLASKLFGIKVEEFGIGLPPRIFSFTFGETIYSLNCLPIGGFVRLMGETDLSAYQGRSQSEDPSRNFRLAKPWKRAVVLTAGVFMNFVLGWFLIAVLLFVGIPKSIIVEDVQPSSPAAAVGILKGDRILDFKSVDELISRAEEMAGREMILRISRGNSVLEYKLTPRVSPAPNEGRIGVKLSQLGTEPLGLISSISTSFLESVKILKLVFLAIFSLLGGILSGSPNFSEVMGPVGIINAASTASSLGFRYFIQLLAFVSLNLVALNIFPFPALDGGGLILLLLEKIRGVPLSLRVERILTSLGFIALLILMAAVTIKDILSL